LLNNVKTKRYVVIKMSPSFVYISALELQKIDKHKKHEIDI